MNNELNSYVISPVDNWEELRIKLKSIEQLIKDLELLSNAHLSNLWQSLYNIVENKDFRKDAMALSLYARELLDNLCNTDETGFEEEEYFIKTNYVFKRKVSKKIKFKINKSKIRDKLKIISDKEIQWIGYMYEADKNILLDFQNYLIGLLRYIIYILNHLM